MTNPLTLNEIYTKIISDIGGPAAEDIDLGALLLAMGAAIAANQGGGGSIDLADITALFTANRQILYGTGASTGELLPFLTALANVYTAAGQILIGTGSGEAALESLLAAILTQFTAAGQLFVGNGAASGTLLSAGTAEYVLTSNGPGEVPSWQSVGSGGSVTASAIYATFTAPGQIYMGIGSATGELLAAGTAGYVFTSNGPGVAASWQVAPGLGGFLPVFNLLDYGAVGNGTTDDTAAIAAAFAACVAAGGGTVFAGPLADGSPANYLWKSTITLPVTSTPSSYTPGSPSIYQSVPIRFTSTGGSMNPRGDVPVDATVVTFAPTSNSFMLQGFGEGTFEFDHVTLIDGAGTSISDTFFLFTNIVSNIHDNAFVGNNTFTLCATDVVHYGGSTATTPNGGATAVFQGYGSKLHNNKCGGIRHLMVGQTAANTLSVEDNNIYNTCGTNLSNDAPIVLAGTAAFPIYSCHIGPNTLEMTGGSTGGVLTQNGYAYGLKLTYASRNVLINNGIWDVGGSTSFVSGIFFDTTSVDNIVIEGEREPSYLWATGNQINNMQVHAAPQLNGNGPTMVGTEPEVQNGGYFLQAGTPLVTTNSGGQATINFPTTFPGGVLGVTATLYGGSSSDARICWVGQVFNTSVAGFKVYIQPEPGSTANQNESFYVSWWAVGF